MVERCKHDMVVGTCTWCTESMAEEVADEVAREKAERLKQRGWFAANYAGVCRTCGEHFEAGDPIHRSSDDRGWSCC